MLVMPYIGETQLDDMGYYDVVNGVSSMPKLEDVTLKFGHTKRLKLKEALKKQLKFCKGVAHDEEGEKI